MLLLLLGLVAIVETYTQDRTLTGTVTSTEDNAPIPGASVVVRGTTRGTTTDADGNFRIQGRFGSASSARRHRTLPLATPTSLMLR